MVPEYNAPGRIQARRLGEVERTPRIAKPENPNRCRRGEAGNREIHTPTDTEKKSIRVVFDPGDPEQAESLERHKAAFGENHAEVEPLENGKVLLQLYPGGARRLL